MFARRLAMDDPRDAKAATGSGLRLIRVLLAAAALTFALASTAAAATPSDPFKGAWTSTDTDGSDQMVSFGGNGATRAVHYFDAGASVCGWPAVNATATLTGMGVVSGTSLTVEAAGKCNGGSGQPLSSTVTYTYDSGTNTLLDSFGVTWYR
jgi:hypothetical protein